MNKQEKEFIDKNMKKICKLKGEMLKNKETGAFEIWVKKSTLIEQANEFIKKLKELDDETC